MAQSDKASQADTSTPEGDTSLSEDDTSTSGDDTSDTGPCALEVDLCTVTTFGTYVIDWSGLTTDIHGVAIDPSSDVNTLTGAIVTLQGPEFVDVMCQDALTMSEISLYQTVATTGTSHTLSFDLSGPDESDVEGYVLWVSVGDTTTETLGGAGCEFSSASSNTTVVVDPTTIIVNSTD